MKVINLIQELEQAQTQLEQDQLIIQAKTILLHESIKEEDIHNRITSKSSFNRRTEAWIDSLNPKSRFNVQSIEQVCVKFRLRFLDGELFEGDIPSDAVREVKRLESSTGVRFNSFKIIAPSDRFHLVDSTKDPILLAELPNGQYLYIFQWGNDLEWYQYILKYPFRHIGSLAISSSIIGLIIAFLVPSQFEAVKAEFFYRFFMFSMTTCMIMTLAIITAIMYSKDFSENVWNSRFIR